MIFSNLLFIFAFLPVSLLIYHAVPGIRAKNVALLVLSLAFYAFGEPLYILVLVAAALSAFLFARAIDRSRGTHRAKTLTAISVIVSLSFLFVFKYVPFLVETVNAVTGAAIPVPRFALPIGISFYTFSILTYTADIYYGKASLQRSFADFLLFVSLFPKLSVGPIERYRDIAPSLSERTVMFGKFASGARLFVCGLAKKVLLADFAGKIADTYLGKAQFTTLGVWLGVLMFTFQIYFDFSGYSDMAIGLGRMLGFEFSPNFNYPYISRSVTEFWRRWHMSLGAFFRDYVYIPLGGNRRHKLRNIAVVWLLTGLWHGASWSFVLWGAYYCALLILEKYVFARIRLNVPSVVRGLYAFFAAVIGWVIFYFTDVRKAGAALAAMFTHRAADLQTSVAFRQNAVFLLVCVVAATPIVPRLYRRVTDAISRRREGAAVVLDTALSAAYIGVLLAVCCAVLVGSSFSPFLYFKF